MHYGGIVMSRASRRRLYKSKAWQKCRDAYYISRFGICERCGGPGVIVHHKIPITDKNIWDPNITLNFDNLELVCIECHNKEHFGEKVMSDEIAFDEFGNLQRKHPPGLREY